MVVAERLVSEILNIEIVKRSNLYRFNLKQVDIYFLLLDNSF